MQSTQQIGLDKHDKAISELSIRPIAHHHGYGDELPSTERTEAEEKLDLSRGPGQSNSLLHGGGSLISSCLFPVACGAVDWASGRVNLRGVTSTRSPPVDLISYKMNDAYGNISNRLKLPHSTAR